MCNTVTESQLAIMRHKSSTWTKDGKAKNTQFRTAQDMQIVNEINLCESCCNNYATCQPRSIIFGTGLGDDNICACDIYKPLVKLKKEVK